MSRRDVVQTSEVEDQLAELHRKYRIMEGNRKSYSEDSQNHIRRQRQAIEKLKEDNASLKTELAMELKDAALAPPPNVQAEITKLQDTADLYTRKIEIERRRVEDLDHHLQLSDLKILEQRRAMGGIHAAKENSHQVTKQVKVLENKLDKALVQFNEALSSNKSLREEIDNLRRERVAFDNVYRKMERELHEKKKEMANIIEISNIAYEARDQAQNEIAALRAQADKESASFEAEWRELGKILESDRKVKEMNMRNKLKMAELGGTGQYGEMSMEDEAKLRKKVIKGNWHLAKDKTQTAMAAERVESYEEAFNKIKQATGITDIDDLVTTFIAAEDQNFSLFNFVNELNQEQEKLEEQMTELGGEIEKFRGAGAADDGVRKKILKDLEGRLERTDAKTDQFELRFLAAMRTVNALKAGITSIYNKIGCNNAASRELLGDQGVNESNMLSYLGVIEQRANEVLQAYAAQQMASAAANSDAGVDGIKAILGATGPMTPANAGGVNIDPPSTADEYASDEESEEEIDDRPLTRDELQAKTLRALNKRESKGGGARRKRR
uniref:ODAD1 central coiled coil region domain-containing protein n=1 Tax=Mantoniella antarctica TaxID=81844 RepID=A0A7S0SDG4_9CHLO|mmetsp:Transcript_20082/g.50040  ORF Transcript_20082/g.50040 Transcript_20082/m.50040 type:complete len:556 (+) Transcript_20082:279-1946(+)|eukprot:CAMPEP_0181374336 /NCGR_PEP_ID=MMETSP1106-20121128/15955_1 /TAXON_ID=81844 /ORGANISM="Mantoniella antarctica, Strain SL-175" /LENGTH=555 /DNA_ID=CAMNT_0023492289 /DNA_START=252 /DNA_END=1919 /DNA_ORIENTATION=-